MRIRSSPLILWRSNGFKWSNLEQVPGTKSRTKIRASTEYKSNKNKDHANTTIIIINPH